MVELKLQRQKLKNKRSNLCATTLSETLAEFRHTQAQLIQKRKMAFG
jgi:hypothetical protein